MMNIKKIKIAWWFCEVSPKPGQTGERILLMRSLHSGLLGITVQACHTAASEGDKVCVLGECAVRWGRKEKPIQL